MRNFLPTAKPLAMLPSIGYLADGPPAAEPTALAVIALAASGEIESAERHVRWLVMCQSQDGSVGVFADQGGPAWCTGLAAMAWSIWSQAAGTDELRPHIDAATRWILDASGTTTPRTAQLGHDPTLIGWSWAECTHSWVEPTAFQVLALKHLGWTDHPRVRDGVRLLLDRQLPSGGCNYGNTFVLGQQLLPHIQPTAIALLALWNESTDSRRTISLNYLRKHFHSIVGHSSRCFATMALRVYASPVDHPPFNFEIPQTVAPLFPTSGYRLALSLLAQLDPCPLVSSQNNASSKGAA
jgi:hypothetical protein